jgi:hypothetical protein
LRRRIEIINDSSETARNVDQAELLRAAKMTAPTPKIAAKPEPHALSLILIGVGILQIVRVC